MSLLKELQALNPFRNRKQDEMISKMIDNEYYEEIRIGAYILDADRRFMLWQCDCNEHGELNHD